MSERLAGPAAILEDLLRIAGAPAADGAVRFEGEDPVLPTAFRIGEFAAAAIGAAALQVARLHEQAAGVRQDVGVDVEAAAIATRSSRELVADPPLPVPELRTVGWYRTRDDRWLFTQRLFPHHFRRQLEVLGCEPTEEAIAAAVARHDAQWLEDRMVAAGASAALVRSREEWAAHPQAQALAGLPLLEIRRIAPSDPIPLPAGDRPLSGLRVLDLTRVLAGPTAGRTLAEHGADVLRISSPRTPDDTRMMIDTGHGKRSTVLDLATSSGRAAIRELLRTADVFTQGYRPGAIANFGLWPGELASLRPGIICTSISAFGRLGPWSRRRGFDSIVQAASGIMLANAVDDRPRALPSNPLDYITGYLAAFGTLVALERRAREGGSYTVELSLAQTGRYLDERLELADPAAAATRPAEPPAEVVERLSIERDTEFGRLRYLAPVAQLSATPAAWALPTVPADHDEPVWL